MSGEKATKYGSKETRALDAGNIDGDGELTVLDIDQVIVI
jgi:hypothetical protein